MSLINQMLRDLDARQGDSATAPSTARSVARQRANRRRWVIPAAIIAIVAAGGIALWLEYAHKSAPQHILSMKITHGSARTSPPNPHPPASQRPVPAAAGMSGTTPAANGAHARLSAVIASGEYRLILTFSPALPKPVLAGPGASIRAHIPANGNLEALGNPPHLKGLAAFRLAHTADGLLLLAHATPGFKVRLEPAPNAAPLGAALTLTVVPPATSRRPQDHSSVPATQPPATMPTGTRGTGSSHPAHRHPHHASVAHHAPPAKPARTAPSERPKANIRRVPETPAQRAAHDYDQAVKALRDGDSTRGEALLRKALARKPVFADARLLLAGVLMRAHRNKAALKILTEGIEQGGGGRSRLALLKARIFAQRGQLPAAVSVLEHNAPNLRGHAAYHARLAAYEEQAAQYAAAATEYRALVATSPGNARWWLGLAIALDQQGKAGAATAYGKALDAGGLPSRASAYAHSRLKALGGH